LPASRRAAAGRARSCPIDPTSIAPAEWDEETHKAARTVWEQLPASRVVDDAYIAKVLPTLDRQLG
jgi:hypothetical protein